MQIGDGAATGWGPVIQSPKARYTPTGLTPGQKVVIRVAVQRKSGLSTYSEGLSATRPPNGRGVSLFFRLELGGSFGRSYDVHWENAAATISSASSRFSALRWSRSCAALPESGLPRSGRVLLARRSPLWLDRHRGGPAVGHSDGDVEALQDCQVLGELRDPCERAPYALEVQGFTVPPNDAGCVQEILVPASQDLEDEQVLGGGDWNDTVHQADASRTPERHGLEWQRREDDVQLERPVAESKRTEVAYRGEFGLAVEDESSRLCPLQELVHVGIERNDIRVTRRARLADNSHRQATDHQKIDARCAQQVERTPTKRVETLDAPSHGRTCGRLRTPSKSAAQSRLIWTSEARMRSDVSRASACNP